MTYDWISNSGLANAQMMQYTYTNSGDFVIKDSSDQGNAPVEEPSPAHHYTVVLTSTKAGNSQSLGETQASTLKPVVLGGGAVFFRKENPTDCRWKNVVIVPGKDVTLPEHLITQQSLQFTVSSSQPIVEEPQQHTSNIAANPTAPYIYTHPASSDIQPKDLAEALQLQSWRPQGPGRLYVLTFLKFSSEIGKARYFSEIDLYRHVTSEPGRNKWGMQVHLVGAVSHGSRAAVMDANDEGHQEGHEPLGSELESMEMDSMVVLSFPGVGRFGEWVASEQHRFMLGYGGGGVKEGFVLTERIDL